MSRYFAVLGAAVGMVTLLSLSRAGSADFLEQNHKAATAIESSIRANAAAADLLELRPGLTKLVKPSRSIRAVAIGNPNVADATIINLRTVAVTGKGIGATNLVLFDDEGNEISNSAIQVVRGDAYGDGSVVEARREVSVVSLGAPTRRYLCHLNCSDMNDVPALSSNPPTAGAPPSATPPTTTLINVPAVATQAPPASATSPAQ